jgi:hypothetical protein
VINLKETIVLRSCTPAVADGTDERALALAALGTLVEMVENYYGLSSNASCGRTREEVIKWAEDTL